MKQLSALSLQTLRLWSAFLGATQKLLSTALMVLALITVGNAVSALGQDTIIEQSRIGGATQVANSDFVFTGFTTTTTGNHSSAPGLVSGVSTSSRIAATGNPGSPGNKVVISPNGGHATISGTTTPGTLQVGTTYQVAVSFAGSPTAASPDIVVTNSDTGTSGLDTFAGATSTAFQAGSGYNQWNLVGTITIASASPTITFAYFGGVSGRWNVDSIRFLPVSAPPTAQYWDTGSLGGSGTWDTITPNWVPNGDGSGTAQAYIQNNLADFRGTSGTVTIASGGVTMSGGLEFDVNGYVIAGDTLTLDGSTGPGTNITVLAGNTATINSVISGTYGLCTAGPGTLLLNTNVNFSGTVTLNSGTLSLGTNLTFDSLAGISAGKLSLLTNTLTISGTNNTTCGAVITDSGASTPGYLVKQGTNTQTLTGTSTFHGPTTIAGGALTIAADANLGAAPSSPVANQIILSNAARLDFSANASLNVNRGITLGTGDGLLSTPGTGTTPTIAGTISGSGNLFIPTGGFDLTGTNTFTGNIYLVGTNVDSGGNNLSSIRFDSTAASGSGKIFMMPGNGKNVTLRTFSYTNSVVPNPIEFDPFAGSGLYLSGAVASGKICTLTLSGDFNGTGGVIAGLSFSGGSGNPGGTVAISGSNSAWSGGLTLQYGNLALGSSNALGTGTFNIQALDAGTALGLMATTPLTGASAVTNAMTINLSGGSGAYVVIGGTNSLEISGPVSLHSNSAITVTNTGASILSGGISDSVPSSGYSLTIAGTGTLTLSGVSTYDGGTFINSGTVVGHVSNSIPGDVTVNGGTLQLDVTNAMSPNATLTVGAATVNLNFTGYQTVSSVNGNSGPATYGASANNLGGAITGTGFLNVIPLPPPFSITSEALDATGTNFVVCWTSVAGQNYDVMTNISLTGNGAWVSAGYTNATGTTTCFTLPGGILRNPSVFVRIQAP
jgi:autotransporter-associated beta strand protein